MQDLKEKEVEINFRDVLKTPVRWFGVIYPYFITAFILLGLSYIHRLDVIHTNETPPALKDTTAIVEDLIPIKGEVSAGIDLATIRKPSDKQLQRGKELYIANCAVCHGEKGNGDGPGGMALQPKPRNYHDKQGWKNGNSFSQIFKTLQEGIPKTGMTSYDFLPVEERIDIIHFLRTLASELPPPAESELKEMDQAYSLSAGRKVPSQIPVSMAVVKIAEESKQEEDNVKKIIENINSYSTSAGSDVFNKVASDKKKVVTSLLKTQSWRAGTNVFLNFVTGNRQIGFKPDVLLLSNDEWTNLYNFLSSTVKVN